MKSPSKKLIKQCDDLWSEIIKLRAGHKSEISGKLGKKHDKDGHILNTHHIAGKGNYALRYRIENGICLTQWEHLFGIHSRDPLVYERFRKNILRVKGEDIFEKMKVFKNVKCTDLYSVKIYLEQELERLKNEKNKL